jgi:hypothetical protein
MTTPTFDESTCDETSSTYDGASSTYDGASSTYDGASSTYDGASSTHVGASSTYDGASSTHVGASSTHDGASSTHDETSKKVQFQTGLMIEGGNEKGSDTLDSMHIVPDHVFGILFLGGPGAGKSQIIHRVSRASPFLNIR